MSSQSFGKGSSRWGSFLQQAVAGVESRLDTILADDESKPSADSANSSRQTPETLKTGKRYVSNSRSNDPLQERLAKVVIARTIPNTIQTANVITARPLGTGPSIISLNGEDVDDGLQSNLENKLDSPERSIEPVLEPSDSSGPTGDSNDGTNTLGIVEQAHDSLSCSLQNNQDEANLDQAVNHKESPNRTGDVDTRFVQPSSPYIDSCTHPAIPWRADGSDPEQYDHNTISTRWREDTRAYIEHIDALQTKLRRLTKEASDDVSRRAESNAAADVVEAQLITREYKWSEQLRELQALLEAEKRKSLVMQDEASTVKVEKELGDERQRARLCDLQEKIDRERVATKRVESDLRRELEVLESRLESYRLRAEEASSHDTKDFRAKLLRQTDVLQSQYSIAAQNWRGIESSLLSRISNIEKERDQTAREENESRRRIREANIKLRRAEEQLHQATKVNAELEETVNQMKKAIVEKEVAFKNTQAELEAVQQKLKEENTRVNQLAKQRNDLTSLHRERTPFGLEITPQHRAIADSSIHHLYSKPSADNVKPNGRAQPTKPALGLGNESTVHMDRPLSRRQSAQPSNASGIISPFRQDSTTHLTYQNLKANTPETASIIRTEQFDDFFDDTTTPLTPDLTINDVISVSTTAAGPSVQLIERMSAAVRRLESEKASSRDELDRVTTQRDENRKQVVSLMQQLEERKEASDRVKVLEQEITAINQRYQTTLEMLGEKSELVEELQADVADVKQMYKDLIETTLR